MLRSIRSVKWTAASISISDIGFKARIRLEIEIEIGLEFNQSEERKPISSLVKRRNRHFTNPEAQPLDASRSATAHWTLNKSSVFFHKHSISSLIIRDDLRSGNNAHVEKNTLSFVVVRTKYKSVKGDWKRNEDWNGWAPIAHVADWLI